MRMTTEADVLHSIFDAVASVEQDEILLTLKEDRIISKMAGGASALMTAVRVSDNELEEYDTMGDEEIAFQFTKVKNFIPSGDTLVTLDSSDNKLDITAGSAHLQMGMLRPDSLEGNVPSPPSNNYEAVASGKSDHIRDFINKAEDVVGSTAYFLCAKDEGIYLYADADTGGMDDFIPADEFDTYETDWSANDDYGDAPANAGSNERIDAIMSTEMTSSMADVNDRCIMHFADNMPMKWLYTGEEGGRTGVDISYIQAPRVSDEGKDKVPDSVISSR